MGARLAAAFWAPVSEPGFLDFHISRFSIIDIFLFATYFYTNMLVRYRGINNKGVLDRPLTKWRVLSAISSTLKFQFTVNPESLRFLKLRTIFPHTSVLSKPPQLPYGVKKSSLS